MGHDIYSYNLLNAQYKSQAEEAPVIHSNKR